MPNRILLNQNMPGNLKKLAAQRQLYIHAKRILIWQIILTVPITIILSIVKLVPSSLLSFNITPYCALYGVTLSIIDIVVFNKIISNYRNDAAKVQEDFDCEVYEMEWNAIFVGKKVLPETINKYWKEYIPNPESPIENWYPIEIEPLSHNQAILVCQKTNLYYDSSLRKKYKNASIVMAIITLFLLVICSLTTKINLQSFIISIIGPFLPVFILTFKINAEHTKSINAATDLHQTISSFSDNVTIPQLRIIQDKIYCHRKDSPLIPDFFYNRKREKLEEQMHINASQ